MPCCSGWWIYPCAPEPEWGRTALHCPHTHPTHLDKHFHISFKIFYFFFLWLHLQDPFYFPVIREKTNKQKPHLQMSQRAGSYIGLVHSFILTEHWNKRYPGLVKLRHMFIWGMVLLFIQEYSLISLFYYYYCFPSEMDDNCSVVRYCKCEVYSLWIMYEKYNTYLLQEVGVEKRSRW